MLFLINCYHGTMKEAVKQLPRLCAYHLCISVTPSFGIPVLWSVLELEAVYMV